MASNYPAGAEDDPNAPFNEDICEYDYFCQDCGESFDKEECAIDEEYKIVFCPYCEREIKI